MNKLEKLPHGILISIEGIDGSGKSTLSKNLNEYFTKMGFSVLLTKEPGGTTLGQSIRTILHERDFNLFSKAEFLLFAADRAQHFEELIKPALNKGQIVISDRMADSSLAYQGYGRNVSKEHISYVNKWAMDNIEPDIILYINIDYKTAKDRLISRNLKPTSFEQEQESFFNKVIDGFNVIFKDKKNVITLDGNLSQEDIIKDAIFKLENYFNKNSKCCCC